MTKRGEEVVTGTRSPLGYIQILNATLHAGAVSIGPLIPTLPAGDLPLYAVIQSNGGTIRWRDDGTAPTSTIGMVIASGGELLYAGDLYTLQLIEATGTPIADISFYY